MDPRKPWKGKLASLKHKKMSTRQELEYQNPEFNGGDGGTKITHISPAPLSDVNTTTVLSF